MIPANVVDLKTFVPAKDFQVSAQYYKDLGFTLNRDEDGIKEFQIGAFRFLLQDYWVEDWAGNFMMYLQVDDLEAWWKHIQQTQVTEKYEGIRATAPKLQPDGTSIVHLTDPAGVCWNIVQKPRQT